MSTDSDTRPLGRSEAQRLLHSFPLALGGGAAIAGYWGRHGCVF